VAKRAAKQNRAARAKGRKAIKGHV
jgi:hypothetical protein